MGSIRMGIFFNFDLYSYMNGMGSGDSSCTSVPKSMASYPPSRVPISYLSEEEFMSFCHMNFLFIMPYTLNYFYWLIRQLKVYGFFSNSFSMCIFVHHMNYLCFSLLVSWTKDGREIQDTGRFRFHSDGNTFTFEIPAALATDSGQYAATARSSRGSTQWAFTLHVAVSLSPCADIDVVQLIRSMQVNKN